MDHASSGSGGVEDGEVSSVFAAYIARLAVHGSVNHGENVDEKEGHVVDYDANTNADDTENRHEEPEECILRSKEEVILGEVDRDLGRVRSPMERIIGLREGFGGGKRSGQEGHGHQKEWKGGSESSVESVGEGDEKARFVVNLELFAEHESHNQQRERGKDGTVPHHQLSKTAGEIDLKRHIDC